MSTIENNTKTNDVEQYKCPNCGGSIEFDSKTQQMKCPYCDSEFDMQTLKDLTNINSTEELDPEWEAYGADSGNGDWTQEERDSVSRYVCQSCGGEIITDVTTVASKCPYCDSQVVIASELAGAFRPDLLIPFKYDKKAAKESLYGFFKNKKLLPNCFKEETHIEEIQGIYVPFWLFNCTADGKAVFSATKMKRWSDSNYNYTKTSHYAVTRAGEMDFIKVPADGSEKMDDTLMESIEPYNYADAVDFQTAYLSGYLAEKYDVTSDQNQSRINERIVSSLMTKLKGTVHGYSTVVPGHKSIAAKNGEIQYALLPVWMLNTKYNGKNYVFAMNGQTGKFVGDLPIDQGKAVKYFMKAYAICAAIGIIITMFI
ncbi:MAG: hypothetical protein R3Y58_13450 [Eubacteriales bacterium]